MKDGEAEWARIQAERDRAYLDAIRATGVVPGQPAEVVCPLCGNQSWLRLPPNRRGMFMHSVIISCPTACGYFGELSTFQPQPATSDAARKFDRQESCPACDCQFAV